MMSVRLRVLCLPMLALALGVGSGPASALDDAFSDAPPPRRMHAVPRAARAPGLIAPPAIVSGFLPRNNAVPLYNEPPGLRNGGYDRR